MTETKSTTSEKYVCKNCETAFHGNFCPECGQSIKEFERPFRFLIIDLTGNIFAFDTRFWKTLVAILFKPGKLTLDYVKGHRVRYMPPFRFYVFISFIFFLLLNSYTTRLTKTAPDGKSNVTIFGDYKGIDSINATDSINAVEEIQTAPPVKDDIAAKKDFFNEHPELFFEQFLTNLSWAMFLLMPFYGFLLWLFHRKSQRYYIIHFIMAINQHAFMFFVLIIVFSLARFLPDFSEPFRKYLLLLIPVYLIVGFKTLYKQKIWKIVLKLFTIAFIYTLVISAVAVGLILLVVVENGINL